MRPTNRFSFTNLSKYRTIGCHLYPRLTFMNPEWKTIRFQEGTKKHANSVLLTEKYDLVTKPYYQPELMEKLHKHLPTWLGFQTWHYTYVQGMWNSIYGELDFRDVAVFIQQEKPLLQRDRLAQIFAACPAGSYGYYAARGLAPFKLAVGSFASAQIDEFFASNIDLLTQPFSKIVNDIMSTKETAYWKSQKEFTNWLAGHFLSKGGREKGVAWPAALHRFAYGTPVPEGEVLNEEQLAKLKAELEEQLPRLDVVALEDFLADDAEVAKIWEEIKARQQSRRD
jgi:hypothetical protein